MWSTSPSAKFGPSHHVWDLGIVARMLGRGHLSKVFISLVSFFLLPKFYHH